MRPPVELWLYKRCFIKAICKLKNCGNVLLNRKMIYEANKEPMQNYWVQDEKDVTQNFCGMMMCTKAEARLALIFSVFFLGQNFLPGLWSQSLWKCQISPQQAPGSVAQSIGELRWQTWQRCRVSEAHLFRNKWYSDTPDTLQFCSIPCNCSSARWGWINNTLSQAHDHPWSTWDSHFVYCVLFPFPKEPFTPWYWKTAHKCDFVF